MPFHDICPYRIGSRVRINPTNKYAGEWPGTYAVVSIEWDYKNGSGHEINIGIASDEDIMARHGWTDGWAPSDLLPVAPSSPVSPDAGER